jgi:hypothetical protein
MRPSVSKLTAESRRGCGTCADLIVVVLELDGRTAARSPRVSNATGTWAETDNERRDIAECLLRRFGGEGRIRPPDRLAPMPHFECGALDHSAISPGATMGDLGHRGWSELQARAAAQTPRAISSPCRWFSTAGPAGGRNPVRSARMPWRRSARRHVRPASEDPEPAAWSTPRPCGCRRRSP